MKYIYGPVNSRRLGLSLGVTLTPYKVCSFDCIYCQLGKTTLKTTQIKEYINLDEILSELRSFLANLEPNLKLNYITISGSGEPTLNPIIKELIPNIKKITTIPVALITNSSLLSQEVVRNCILEANLVITTLNTANKEIFERISRPHPSIKIEEIVLGLINFRNIFKGKIFLEIMVIKGVNDSLKEIRRLKEAVDKINPDKIHLTLPLRLPSEEWVTQIPSENKLNKMKEILGDRCEIV